MSETRPCPICSAENNEVLHHQRFEEGSLGDGYCVVVCQHCGGGFADGIPQQSELDLYYSEQSRYMYDWANGVESEFDLRRFQATVDQLAPYLKPSSKILDIGCATGGLLSVFKARGYMDCVGADPSEGCVAAARRIYGVDARKATFSELVYWTDKFDVILLLGVLEHIRDVQVALRVAVQLLSPGGMIYAAVPDVQGLAAARNAPFQQFSMEHVNFFSELSLKNLFRVVGLNSLESWRWSLEWREGVTEPIVSALFRNASTPIAASFDPVTRTSLLDYIAVSKAADARIYQLVDELVEDGRPLLIWGTGALTRRLLAETRLREANIVGFIDSSGSQQKKHLLGLVVLSPKQAANRSESILICSIAFKEEILRIIKDEIQIPNQILVFQI